MSPVSLVANATYSYLIQLINLIIICKSFKFLKFLNNFIFVLALFRYVHLIIYLLSFRDIDEFIKIPILMLHDMGKYP
jgi:hypothetical protein